MQVRKVSLCSKVLKCSVNLFSSQKSIILLKHRMSFMNCIILYIFPGFVLPIFSITAESSDLYKVAIIYDEIKSNLQRKWLAFTNYFLRQCAKSYCCNEHFIIDFMKCTPNCFRQFKKTNQWGYA